jgi:hypothetical protein
MIPQMLVPGRENTIARFGIAQALPPFTCPASRQRHPTPHALAPMGKPARAPIRVPAKIGQPKTAEELPLKRLCAFFVSSEPLWREPGRPGSRAAARSTPQDPSNGSNLGQGGCRRGWHARSQVLASRGWPRNSAKCLCASSVYSVPL